MSDESNSIVPNQAKYECDNCILLYAKSSGEKVEWMRLAGQGWADYVCQTRRIGDLAERLVGNDWRILRKQDPDYFFPSLKSKQTNV